MVMGIPGGLDRLLTELVADAVSLEPAPGDPDIRSSYLGGHPYWTEGSRWPHYRGEPMSFVCQINFAEAPRRCPVSRPKAYCSGSSAATTWRV